MFGIYQVMHDSATETDQNSECYWFFNNEDDAKEAVEFINSKLNDLHEEDEYDYIDIKIEENVMSLNDFKNEIEKEIEVRQDWD